MISDTYFFWGVVTECIIFIFYMISSYMLKRGKVFCVLLSIILYSALCLCAVPADPLLFYICFTAANFIIMTLCCAVDRDTSARHSIIVTLILLASELIVVFSDNDINIQLTFGQSLKFLIKTRIIYALGLLIMYSLCSKKIIALGGISPFNVIVHSVSAAIMVITIEEAFNSRPYIMIYIMLIAINISVFATGEFAALKNKEIQSVIDASQKHESELESYKLMYEKYENTRVMRHDFKEQLSTLRDLIDSDSAEAKRYFDKLDSICRELDFTEYTNNTVLNILLDRKIRECHDKGINLYISSTGARLDFLSEFDTVAIFSNLINNAMESCIQSTEKNIFIDFGTKNENFTVIKIENNCDEPPTANGSSLITKKSDNEMHGLGMKSVETALNSYNGEINWSYDAERKFFRITVVFAYQDQRREILCKEE